MVAAVGVGVSVKEKKRPTGKCVAGGWHACNQTFSVSDSVTHHTLSFQSVTGSATPRRLQNVAVLFWPFGSSSWRKNNNKGKKTFKPKKLAMLSWSLLFFFFHRFTAWAKIINILPTEQLVAAEKFCLHLSRCVFQLERRSIWRHKNSFRDVGRLEHNNNCEWFPACLTTLKRQWYFNPQL